MSDESFIAKFFNFIANSAGNAKGNNISARKAAALQHKFIIDTTEENNDMQTDSVLEEIGAQLNNPKEDIFDAALFYLYKIASSNSQYIAQIKHLLDDNLQKNKKNSARKEKIANVKRALNI